jgi:asparagine synthase (glutamine-hydrolysing)
MCGFAGFIGYANVSSNEASTVAQAMASALAHRGPDDAGVWQDDQLPVVLAHRRLAVVDVSSAGHQPMVSAAGRYVLIFNGEIYNHTELRHQLQPMTAADSWQGHADSETLLAAVEYWGLEKTLPRLVGMFALVLWDRKNHTLSIVRDRLGEKPVYYGWQGKTLLFASELSACKAHPAFEGTINRQALSLYLRYNNVPSPHSIYRGMHKLAAGCVWQVSVDSQGQAVPDSVRQYAYWSLDDMIRRGQENPLNDPLEAETLLEQRLRQAVRQQMLADVPVGAFLSGGIDSSLISALMQDEASVPIQTFTLGFHEAAYNEAEDAQRVANHLGTEHHTLMVTASQARTVIPQLPTLYSEPFADSSQIAVYLLAEMTRQRVTVALSGDGGDELFGGYNRYLRFQRWWPRMQRIPLGLRQSVGRGLAMVPARYWHRLGEWMNRFPGQQHRWLSLADQAEKTAAVWACKDVGDWYQTLVSHWQTPQDVVLGGQESAFPKRHRLHLSGIEQMMRWDSQHYLPDDILTKVDRATMGVGLETRVPMLDHRVVELAWQLPLSMKTSQGQGKQLLRRILQRYVPNSLINRPKTGFAIPLDAWLRGPLRDWGEHLLHENRLQQEGFFHAPTIRQAWQEHQLGSRNRQHLLWNVLMFQAWLDAQ